MQHRSVAWVSLFAALLLGSCQARNSRYTSVAPGIDLPARNVNTVINLVDPPILRNSHRNNQPLTLKLTSSAHNSIIFPENFGVRVLEEQKGTWIDVQNHSYNGHGPFILPPKTEAPGGFILGVLPYIPGLSAETRLRVVVVGQVDSVDGEAVAAYLDVPISP